MKIEALSIALGQRITITFESVGQRFRQGVYLQTNGTLGAAGRRSNIFEFWSDATPKETVIDVLSTDGKLILYNIWDSGRGRQSQGWKSGMYVEDLPDGSHRYSCTDTGLEPDFRQLIFRLDITSAKTRPEAISREA
ncbi:MAG: hypothetical protein ABI744_03395 [Chloroflexota bacterium]